MDMNGKMTFQALSPGTQSAVSLGRVRTWEAGMGWEGFEKQEKHKPIWNMVRISRGREDKRLSMASKIKQTENPAVE